MSTKLINYVTALKGAPTVINGFKQMKAQLIGLKTANMNLTKTMKVADGTYVKLSARTDATGKKMHGLKTSVIQQGAAVKKSTGIMSQYGKALMRVAIVVPVWQAFRVIMQAVSSTIREGYEQIKKLSAELLRASSVIHNTVLSTGQALGILKETVRELSIDTGVSMDKLANAFYRFGTVGNDFENSMGGMTASLQTALAMQGNTTEIAKTMALTYKLLGDSVDNTLPPLERQRLMGAQLYKLYKTNAFEIDEMDAALRQFLPTANTANFSYAQSISLLAALQSAGLKSSRAGRLLRTSIGKLIDNLDDLAGELGIAVNPELESTFDVLMKVLSAIDNMSKSGKKLPLDQLKSLKSIFGGIRSQEAGKALVSVLGVVKQNLADTAANVKTNTKNFEDFDTRIKQVSEDTSTIIDKNNNLKKIIGEVFLTGITGSKDFNGAMLTLNKILKKTVELTDSTSRSMNKFAQGGTIAYLTLSLMEIASAKADASTRAQAQALLALEGSMPIDKMKELAKALRSVEAIKLFKDAGKNIKLLQDGVDQAILRAQGKETAEIQVKWDMDVRQANLNLQESKARLEGDMSSVKIPLEITVAKEKADAALKLVQEQLNDTTKMKSAENALNTLIALRVEEYNKLAGLKKSGLSQISEEFVKTNALNGTYENILGVMTDANNSKAFLLELVKKVFEYNKAILQTEKELVDIERARTLERMSAGGASALQIANKKLELARGEKEIKDAMHKVELEQLKKIEKQRAKIRDITKSSLADAMKEGDFSGAFDSFKEGLRNAFFEAASEGLTNQIMNLTGLDTILGKGLDTIQIERAFDDGTMKLVNGLDGAFDRGAAKLGGVGGASGGVGGTGRQVASVMGQPVLKSQVKPADSNWFGAGGNFWKLAGVGLMAASLFGGGGRTNNTSHRYSTAPGATTSAATTRSTVKAKVTNIVLNATFNLPEGLGVEGSNLVKEVEGKITPLIRDIATRVLEEESIASGNV